MVSILPPKTQIFLYFLKNKQKNTAHKRLLSHLQIPCPVSLKHNTFRWKLLQVRSKKSSFCLLRFLFTVALVKNNYTETREIYKIQREVY